MDINENALGNCITRYTRKSGRSKKSAADKSPDRAPEKFNDYLRVSSARRKKVNISIIRWHLNF